MQIHYFPVLQSNYTFLLWQGRQAVVIDPAVAAPVHRWLQQHHFDLVAILNTHADRDHMGGNQELLRLYPEAVVYGSRIDGPEQIPGLQVALEEGDRVSLWDQWAEVWFLPGHTPGHIAYYLPPQSQGDWGDFFCGDILFGAGCGRVRGGHFAQAQESLAKIRGLPDTTYIWCAHEYTLNNLSFSLGLAGSQPLWPALQQRYDKVQAQRRADQPTIPLNLGEEKQTNLFLRWDDPMLQQQLATRDDLQTFTKLRQLRDTF
jgi:hydroxyacylglutathione hydrolase